MKHTPRLVDRRLVLPLSAGCNDGVMVDYVTVSLASDETYSYRDRQR